MFNQNSKKQKIGGVEIPPPAAAAGAGGGGFGAAAAAPSSAGAGAGGGGFGAAAAAGGGGFGADDDEMQLKPEIDAFVHEIENQLSEESNEEKKKVERTSAKKKREAEIEKAANLLTKIANRNVRRRIETDMMGKLGQFIEEVPEELDLSRVGSDFDVASLPESSKKELYRSKQFVSSHQAMMDTPLGDTPELFNKLKAIVCGVCLRFIMTTTGNMNPNQVDPVKHTSYILRVLNLLSKQPEIYELVQQDSHDGEPNPMLVSICEAKCVANHENESFINSIVTFIRSNFTISAVVSAVGAGVGMAVSSTLYPTVYNAGISLVAYITTGSHIFAQFSYEYPLLVLAIAHSIALYHSDYLKMCRSTFEKIIRQFGGVVPQPNQDRTIRGIFDRLLEAACPVERAQYFHPDSYTGKIERYVMRLASTFCAGVSGSAELVRRNPLQVAASLFSRAVTGAQAVGLQLGDQGHLTVINEEPEVMISFLRKLQGLEDIADGENKRIIKQLIRRISFQLKGLYADNVALHDALLILMNKMFPEAFPSKFDELSDSTKAQRPAFTLESLKARKEVMEEEVQDTQRATEITELGIVELDTNVFGPFRDEPGAVVTEENLDAWLTEAVKDARSISPGFPVVHEAKVVVDPLSLFFACFRPKQLSERPRPAEEILGKLQRLQHAEVSSEQRSDQVIDITDSAIKVAGELTFRPVDSGALSDQGSRRIRIIMGKGGPSMPGGKSRRKSRKNTKRTRRNKGRKSSKSAKKTQQRRSSRYRRSSRKGRK
jgi:hypothetical protein